MSAMTDELRLAATNSVDPAAADLLNRAADEMDRQEAVINQYSGELSRVALIRDLINEIRNE